MNIKRSVRIALAKKDMTQAEMAKIVGVTPATLSLIINREEIPTGRLEQFATAFEMSVSDFIKLGED